MVTCKSANRIFPDHEYTYTYDSHIRFAVFYKGYIIITYQYILHDLTIII